MHTLIADDDPITRRVLSKMLSRFGSVDEVTDGAAVLAAVETALSWGSPPDLICLDARMPDMPGLLALGEIRALEERMCARSTRRSKVLMITSVRDGAAVIEAFREQADGYLNKPITLAQLNEKIQTLGLV